MGLAIDGTPTGREPASAAGDIEACSQSLAEIMLECIIQTEPKSGAEALKVLRAAFPDSPLAARVAVLNLLTRR